MKKTNLLESIIHGIFLILGLVTIGCVLLITVYLVISGIPAIQKIGLADFLFGDTWASTAAEPKYGILPFILTSIYGTVGAIALGVPIGFLTAVYLAKIAPQKVKAVMGQAVSMLAGIPSVVYGLVGMMVLVPGIRKVFGVPDGASLLAAMIVLAIMILPSIIKMSVTALEAVPKEYEDACKYRQELTSTGDVITTVSQNPGAIGYASVASVKDTVKALTVAGVAPSNETILDGTYVIQRPFVLVTKADGSLSAAAQAFFDYALSADAHEIIIAAGVVPAN